MLRSTVSKVMWVGRAAVFLVGLAVMVALVFGAASAALGANGKPWILGQKNFATAITSLGGVAGVDGPTLRIGNNNAGTDDTALSLNVRSGEPPMKVNSRTKVTKLNADQLDGISSNELVRSGLGVTENSFPGISFTDRTTVTVNAPAKGFVLVNGTVIGQTDSTSCNPCHVFARVRHDNSQQQSAGMTNTIGDGTTNTSRTTVPMTWVFPVQAGPNTFTLTTGTFPDPAPISFFNPTLTALYVPFGSSGTSALKANSTTTSSTQGERGQSDGVKAK